MQRPSSRPYPLLLSALLVGALCLCSFAQIAEAKPKTHTVYAGQRLGSIAKRYNVSIDELCRANGITRKTSIQPGQKLIIPGTDDGANSKAKKSSDKKNSKAKNTSSAPRPKGKTRVHVVASGHTLSAVAGRYAITVTSLCNANGISRHARLSVGQKLIIPHKTDKGGEYAKKQRLRGDFDSKAKKKAKNDEDDRKNKKSKSTKKKSWQKYVKPAWRSGFIKIRRYGRYWEGYVIGPKNQVLGHASNKINFVLGAQSDGPRIDPKLVRMIASISDKFGGREMRIVSGYRTKSFVAASKHKKGKALDFSIPGIPNEALRDYLRSLDNVGVGYYPNSSFVHLDVRGYNSYWIDHAGPGQAPRIAGKKKSIPKSKAPTQKAPAQKAPTQKAPEPEAPAGKKSKAEAPAGKKSKAKSPTTAPGKEKN